jgi:hypothetical protein
MHDTIKAAFIALSSRAKIAVLSRTIHMETIHNRDRPEDPQQLYRSSEFIHRLSGFIMSLSYRPDEFQRDSTHASSSLIEGVATHGKHYLTKLHGWIVEARDIS